MASSLPSWSVRTTCASWLIAAVVGALCPMVDAATGQSVVRGIHLLPAGGRASIVIELDTEGMHATAVDSDDATMFVVDIGPLAPSPVGSATLRAAEAAPLVREVSIQGLNPGPNETIVRVAVRLRAPATGSVRTTQRRVYIDFAPRGNPVAHASAPPITPPGRQPEERSVEGGRSATRATAQSPLPAADESPEAMLERASRLAKIPDVKGLVSLRDDVLRRNGASSAGAPDQMLARLDEHLAEARALQLAKDASLFRQKQGEQYRAVLQEVAAALGVIDSTLRSSIPDTEAFASVRDRSAALASRVRSVNAPQEDSADHAALADAVGAIGGLAEPPAEGATVSRDDVIAAVDRARSAVAAILGAARPR